MTDDRYGPDVLAGFSRRGTEKPRVVPISHGLVLEDPASGFTGAVVTFGGGLVHLEDRGGGVRTFPASAEFLVDGKRVTLGRPVAAAPAQRRTASGSFAVEDARARVALPSRIYVEGRHDAELVERVWGDDLRVEGVVVEYLEGIDHLERVLEDFRPAPDRRAGVLVDHLVPGSKESRIAEAVQRRFSSVLVVGHPYIDVWQAVKPARLGLTAWPTVERGTEWKHGVCEALGWPHADQADIARAWQLILSKVDSYTDLEPSLLARVEELIDFVTLP
ncbi:hypothetical protein M2152_001492 [Microbacteriaceae bacterium SG_E_30_P1]|uniref:DUF3097 domain-containing protein n=1 Tax=Antiquaquibacter oligotrophicus TaxID=2880260 RepID=A0ABT6KMR9_9MICO|nr:DUF3097 domain-containing protein [Antiquaquibacter oligotrophicus]MDH6181310.1 hypothetical protein [Antiquaquibacter oligotrophicus]UDF12997.1 DUF3097 domain-containing protein [Antiquaquibacter oligotrophicus]